MVKISMPAANSTRTVASIRREKLREQFWPGSASEIWDRKKENGFSTIPRTLGLIMTLIEELPVILISSLEISCKLVRVREPFQ